MEKGSTHTHTHTDTDTDTDIDADIDRHISNALSDTHIARTSSLILL